MKTSTPTPTNKDSFTNIINYQDFYLIKDNIVYKILLGKTKLEILIKWQNYISHMGEQDISTLICKKINSIDEAYEFMLNSFIENRISVKKIKFNEEIILSLMNKNKEINIVLTYGFYKNNDNFLFSEIKQLKNERKELKNEIGMLKEEINELKNKKTQIQSEIEITHKNLENKVPKNIILVRDITEDSYSVSNTDNSFIIFKSINELLYIIYSNIAKSLICYDMEKKKKIKEIKNYHNQFISGFRYFLNKSNNVDLIMSISGSDNNIKILNCNRWEEILNLTKVNDIGFLYSACFLKDNNNLYIVTSNRNKSGDNESIKLFDMKGKKINEIKNSNESTLLIDTYYDNIISKTYIITGNIGYVKSYNYDKNKIYHIYNDNECPPNYGHFGFTINNFKGSIQLIDSCFDGSLRIWNFHSGLFLKKIKVSDKGLRSICLWNENYLFVGCDDNSFKLVEIKNGLVINSIKGHNNQVITIKKIIQYKNGDFLLTLNKDKSKLKLWRVES